MGKESEQEASWRSLAGTDFVQPSVEGGANSGAAEWGAIDLSSKPARGSGINPDGTFRMKGVPPGKHKMKFVPLGDPKEIAPPEAVTDKKIQNFDSDGIEIEVIREKVNEVRIDFK